MITIDDSHAGCPITVTAADGEFTISNFITMRQDGQDVTVVSATFNISNVPNDQRQDVVDEAINQRSVVYIPSRLVDRRKPPLPVLKFSRLDRFRAWLKGIFNGE